MRQNHCQAMARIAGAGEFSGVSGRAMFRQCRRGVLVTVEVSGLPCHSEPCRRDTFAMHIHTGPCCTGNAEDPFADVGGHYDLQNCGMPNQAGDLPSLFGCDGYAYASFLTDRFRLEEIVGRTIIIHAHPDGGEKMACGQIRSI